MLIIVNNTVSDNEVTYNIHMSYYSFILSNKYGNLHQYNFIEATQIILIGVGAFNACIFSVIFNVFAVLCR